jgi:hypothetical protein
MARSISKFILGFSVKFFLSADLCRLCKFFKNDIIRLEAGAFKFLHNQHFNDVDATSAKKRRSVKPANKKLN